jgi:hypothetical protein
MWRRVYGYGASNILGGGPGQGWEPLVTCTCVESRGETLILDPLAPPADATDFWKRLDTRPPNAAVILKPDHVRDVDLFVQRYNLRAFGPRQFFREDIPRPNCNSSSPAASFRAVWSPSTMGRVAQT